INGIWRIFRRTPPPAQNAKLTPQQILTAAHARAIAPDAVFIALIYAIFRPNRNQNRLNQPNQMNQSIPPTQPVQPNQPTQPLGGP
ncbi:MAG TPA: hypothetical protein VKR42_01400, partial [Ktedonobacteraceae bacterium]|nr:hypothetical protein [Ktedonobacteraceae bacterium]